MKTIHNNNPGSNSLTAGSQLKYSVKIQTMINIIYVVLQAYKWSQWGEKWTSCVCTQHWRRNMQIKEHEYEKHLHTCYSWITTLTGPPPASILLLFKNVKTCPVKSEVAFPGPTFWIEKHPFSNDVWNMIRKKDVRHLLKSRTLCEACVIGNFRSALNCLIGLWVEELTGLKRLSY